MDISRRRLGATASSALAALVAFPLSAFAAQSKSRAEADTLLLGLVRYAYAGHPDRCGYGEQSWIYSDREDVPTNILICERSLRIIRVTTRGFEPCIAHLTEIGRQKGLLLMEKSGPEGFVRYTRILNNLPV